jgi:hypothetical protein
MKFILGFSGSNIAEGMICFEVAFKDILFLEPTWTALFCCNQAYIGIWKKNEQFFYFNPHSVDEEGNYVDDGRSCLKSFESLPELMEIIDQSLSVVGIS